MLAAEELRDLYRETASRLDSAQDELREERALADELAAELRRHHFVAADPADCKGCAILAKHAARRGR